jgi:hypothetical protein
MFPRSRARSSVTPTYKVPLGRFVMMYTHPPDILKSLLASQLLVDGRHKAGHKGKIREGT